MCKIPALLLMSVLVLIAGCASGPKVYEIRGEAAPVVNRDAAGAPLSVVVRLYQLKDAQEFSKLTFDTLASGRPESELLGAELLEKNEVVLVPGNKHTSSDKLREDTRYVGVVAFFRKPDQHYWRYLIDADKVRSDGLTFKAQDCYLSMLNVKPAPIPGQPQGAKPECNVALAAPVAQPAPPIRSEPAPTEVKQQDGKRKAKAAAAKPKSSLNLKVGQASPSTPVSTAQAQTSATAARSSGNTSSSGIPLSNVLQNAPPVSVNVNVPVPSLNVPVR